MIQVTHSLNSIFLEFKLHLYRSFCSDHLSSFLFLGENKWKAVGPWLGFLATHPKTNMRQWKNNNLKMYLLLLWRFSIVMSVFRGVFLLLGLFLVWREKFFIRITLASFGWDIAHLFGSKRISGEFLFANQFFVQYTPGSLTPRRLPRKMGGDAAMFKLRDGRNSTGGTPWFRLQVVARTDWKTGFFSPFLMVQGDKSLDKPKNAAWN